MDARYERVREGGLIAGQAVLVAVAVDGDGRRQVLAVDVEPLAPRKTAGVLIAPRQSACRQPGSR